MNSKSNISRPTHNQTSKSTRVFKRSRPSLKKKIKINNFSFSTFFFSTTLTHFSARVSFNTSFCPLVLKVGILLFSNKRRRTFSPFWLHPAESHFFLSNEIKVKKTDIPHFCSGPESRHRLFAFLGNCYSGSTAPPSSAYTKQHQLFSSCYSFIIISIFSVHFLPFRHT